MAPPACSESSYSSSIDQMNYPISTTPGSRGTTDPMVSTTETTETTRMKHESEESSEKKRGRKRGLNHRTSPRGAPSSSSSSATTNRSRRRSARGNSSLSMLARTIAENRRVVFITGAGLSVKSGIRPFRGDDGLWSEVVWSNATREAFRKDPLEWYNRFWLKHFPPHYHSYEPNAGHEALAKLASLPPTWPCDDVDASNNVRIITQNVDGLHSRTEHRWDHHDKLIEAHGRVGFYKCIPEEDSDTDDDSTDEEDDRPVKLGSRRKHRDVLHRLRACTLSSSSSSVLTEETTETSVDGSSSSELSSVTVCKYEINESIPAHKLEPPSIREILSTDPSSRVPVDVDSTSASDDGQESTSSTSSFSLPSVPLCPSCRRPCPPQSLLFDEGYHSHAHYEFSRMEEWIGEADALVFVGTSFSVTITDVALRHAMESGIPVFNFNLRERLNSSARLNVENIMGDAGETLTSLLGMCLREMEELGGGAT